MRYYVLDGGTTKTIIDNMTLLSFLKELGSGTSSIPSRAAEVSLFEYCTQNLGMLGRSVFKDQLELLET